MVTEFHHHIGKHVPGSSERPPIHGLLAHLINRCSYITEENSELQRAIAMHDRVAIADALADLVYFAIGTAIDLGIDLDACIREVHRSNMTKTPMPGTNKGCLKEPGIYEEPNLDDIVL